MNEHHRTRNHVDSVPNGKCTPDRLNSFDCLERQFKILIDRIRSMNAGDWAHV